MASKFFPALPRAGRQLTRTVPRPQFRPFSAGPQRFSDVLHVVRGEESRRPPCLCYFYQCEEAIGKCLSSC